MALDFSALRAKLGELTNKTRREDVVWKPSEGENVIRIVPLAGHTNNPFTELYIHYLGRKSYLSPLTFGERDPIEEFGQSLRAGGGLSKEDWSKTKDFFPKLRTYVPIVVRGKESDGVRFWGFGKTTYTELLSIISDPDYGDISDVKEGHDIKITFVPGEKSPTGFAQTSIRVSPAKKPLTTDKELLEKLLKNQPDLFEIYPKQSYEQLTDVLTHYIDPKSSGTNVSRTAASAESASDPDEWASPTAKSSTEKTPTKTKISDDFEEIFNKS